MSVTIKIGLLAKDTYDNLYMVGANALDTKFSSFNYPQGSPFQVEFGKILRCGLVIYASDSTGTYFAIGYGDDNVQDSATPPTNYVALTEWLPIESANKNIKSDIWLKIPSGKYPCIQSFGGNSIVHLFGFQDD